MIQEFKDKYAWLSNMSPFEQPLIWEGISYRTNEHFYVAMKTTDANIRKEISLINSPGKVKRFGRTLEIREDWEDIKLKVMLSGLRWKFSKYNPILREKLIATGEEYLQEGNNWGDSFWGYDMIEEWGHNHLGKLLMQVRSEITA